MEEDAYNRISRRAHELWQQEGYPHGRDREHWNRAAAEWKAVDPNAPKQTGEGRVITVLVVEDEPFVRFDTIDALEEAGFRVIEAARADEALVLLRMHQIDAVFTDVNMPGSMDGLGLVKRIRTETPQMRIIVTSGHVALGAFDLSSGVSFLPKPYVHETLITDESRSGWLARLISTSHRFILDNPNPHQDRGGIPFRVRHEGYPAMQAEGKLPRFSD